VAGGKLKMATQGQTWKWERQPEKCECGMVTRLTKRHLDSVYHRQHRRILSLLRQNCIPSIEIGRRVGVSRERIRQLELILGEPTGRERQTVCTITKWAARQNALVEKKKNHPLVKELAAICAEHNFPMEVVLGGWAKTVKVNGHLCTVCRAYQYRYNSEYPDYVRITFPKRPTKFVLFRHTDRWFVLPSKMGERLSGAKATAFSLDPIPGMGTKRTFHNYLNYTNAWHLLQ
jgi:hypothetical protein